MLELTPEQVTEGYRQNITMFLSRAFQIINPGEQYLHNWHIDCISEYLHCLHEGKIRKLIINVPPRSLKSVMCSTAYPAWLMGDDPTTKIICASYSATLAREFSQNTRLIMQTKWYKELFPKTLIKPGDDRQEEFLTTMRGRRVATSVGGSLTGKGGEYLIMDDPVNPSEAMSDTEREKANTWMKQTFMSRLNDKKTGKMLVIMQRLHEDDVTGMLKQQGIWEHLCLPAYTREKRIIDMGAFHHEWEEGEPLHANREDHEVLDEIRSSMGAYAFAGQYMQEPVPLGEAVFKPEWLEYGTTHRGGLNVYILVDPAGGKKGSIKKDYTAMMVIGLGPDKKYYVLDIVRDKDLDLTKRKDKLFELVAKWNPLAVGYEQYGMLSDLDYIRECQNTMNFRFNIIELAGTKISKEDRIKKLVPLFHDERFILPEYGFYVTNSIGQPIDLVRAFVEEEYLKFPVSGNDDLLDATSRILDADLNATFPRPTSIGSKVRSRSRERTTNDMFL